MVAPSATSPTSLTHTTNCAVYMKTPTIPSNLSAFAAWDATNTRLTYTAMATDPINSKYGEYDVTLTWQSVNGVDLSSKVKKLVISQPACEPSTVTIKTGVTGSLTVAKTTGTTNGLFLTSSSANGAAVDVAVNLDGLFTLSSSTCVLRYTLAWKYSNTQNAGTRASTTFVGFANGTGKSGTVKLATNVSTGGVDGIHVFDVTIKSFANNAIATTQLVTITKTSPECEVATLVSGVTAISAVAYQVAQSSAATASWSSSFAKSNARCAIKYTVNKPTGWDSYITVTADSMHDAFTLAMADSSTVPVGVFTSTVVATTIGGVAQTSATLTITYKIRHATCENSSLYSLTAGSSTGVAIPTITLGSAATTIPYSFTMTPTLCANAFIMVPSVPSAIASYVTGDTVNNNFAVAYRSAAGNTLGPYTLSVTATTIEGNTISGTTWSRAITWQDPCNESIITWTAFGTEPTWTLNVANQELDPSTQITAPSDKQVCLTRITYTFTVPSDLNAQVASTYNTDKKLKFTTNDVVALAKQHTVSLNLKIDGTGTGLTNTFTLTVVDGCPTPSYSAAASTGITYYQHRTGTNTFATAAFVLPAGSTCYITQVDNTDYATQSVSSFSSRVSTAALDTFKLTYTLANNYDYVVNSSEGKIVTFSIAAMHRGVKLTTAYYTQQIEFKKVDPCETANGLQPNKNSAGVATTKTNTITVGYSWHLSSTLAFDTSMYTSTGTFGTFDTARTCTFSAWTLTGVTNADTSFKSWYTSTSGSVASKTITIYNGISSSSAGTYNLLLTPTTLQGTTLISTGYQQSVTVTVVDPCTL